MIYKIISGLMFIIWSFSSMSQFSIGTQTITYNDPDRTGGFGSGGGPGRQIQCEVYYPAPSAGTNTSVANGSFPIVVFGHGFAMAWSAYQNIWEHLVPLGYVVIFPRTEGGLFPAPSHNDFGLDLALVSQRLLTDGNNASSPFYQKLNGKSGIMGHSMGGGATIIAAQNNSNIQTIIGLAPAETNPSAIAAAANVNIPSLVLSGSSDGVTPPSEHHLPIFNALNTNCKSFVTITGGAHCYFANTNFNCDFGEGTASSGITVTREQQQAYMNSVVVPWLNYFLKNENNAYPNFLNAAGASGLVLNEICTNLSLEKLEDWQMQVYPNPATNSLIINIDNDEIFELQLLDATGRTIFIKENVMLHQYPLDISFMENGIYFVHVSNKNKKLIKRFIKQ